MGRNEVENMKKYTPPRPLLCPICKTPTQFKCQIVANGRVIAPEEAYCPKCKRDVLKVKK